jgi:type IV pilus assembly protein PilZ
MKATAQRQEAPPKTPRAHDRKAVKLMIDYQTLDQFFHDYATNISLGGVFIRSKNPLPVGTKLRVSFSLPGLKKMVETWGEVAHVLDARSDEGFTGMGIRFNDLDVASKKVIDDLVAEG